MSVWFWQWYSLFLGCPSREAVTVYLWGKNERVKSLFCTRVQDSAQGGKQVPQALKKKQPFALATVPGQPRSRWRALVGAGAVSRRLGVCLTRAETMIGLPENCARAARVVAKAAIPLEPSKCAASTDSSPRAQRRGARSRRPSGFRGNTFRQRSQREKTCTIK